MADLVQKPPQRDACRGRKVSEDSLVNPGKYHEPRMMVLAVDIDWHDSLSGLPDLGEEVTDTGSLPGPRETLENDIVRPGPEECGPDRERHLTKLGIAVIELFREPIRFEHVPVAEEGLV